MREVTVEHTVPFHDVDPLFVVWHGHYFKYFEYGREALMRAHGLDVPRVVPIPTSGYPTRATRPANSELDCSKAVATFGVPTLVTSPTA